MFTFASVAFAALLGPEPTPQAIRDSVERALPLLAKGAMGHAEQKTCFACHNQGMPMIAFATSRERGLKLPVDLVRDQTKHIHDFLKQNKANYKAGKGTGGQADTAGWALYTLYHAGAEADDVTAAVAEYFLKRDVEKGYWRCSSNRPPSEASAFATTYLGVRALQSWGTPEQQERIAKRIDAVRKWLIDAEPKDTEDRVFRLRALKAVGGDADDLREAIISLRKAQRPDGGWSQLDSLPSDPYATGSVLAALNEVGNVNVTSRTYRRGLSYLLRTQQADGSWFVKSRSKPFQPYYESGFPHEKNQFISSASTAWATTALALALPRNP